MTSYATCHCGATRIALPRIPTHAHTCNCTYCQRAGAVWGYFEEHELDFQSLDGDKVYSASEGLNQHHFCSKCGIQTWGTSPDWSSAYNNDGTPKGEPGVVPTARSFMVNLNTIDDIDWSTISIERMDGRNNW